MSMNLDIPSLTTMFVALAALLTSVYSVIEMRRQRQNAVRPVLVVLEKRVDKTKKDSAHVLYLVNMGQAVAINTEVVWNDPQKDAARPRRLQTEIFPERRAELMRGYPKSCLGELRLLTKYTDVDNIQYATKYGVPEGSAKHSFQTGHGGLPSGLNEYKPGTDIIETPEDAEFQAEALTELRGIRAALERKQP
jgi:hypothetical protein